MFYDYFAKFLFDVTKYCFVILNRNARHFPGKMLAKLGRVLTIVEELKELCGQGMTKEGDLSIDYEEVCRGAKLPTDRDVKKAVANLRGSVEIWLNGKAVTPFVYDDACK